MFTYITGQVYSQCERGWVHHDKSCYLLHSNDKFNWIESQVRIIDNSNHSCKPICAFALAYCVALSKVVCSGVEWCDLALRRVV